MLASVTLEVHLPAGRHSSSTKSVEHSRLGSRLEEGMPSGAANASSNANGRWRRNRKDELNDTRPNRSSQFFETELAEGVGRRDHLNGTALSFPRRGVGVQVIMSDRVSASGSTCRG